MLLGSHPVDSRTHLWSLNDAPCRNMGEGRGEAME